MNPNEPGKLFVVGRLKNTQHTGGAWDLVGVYSDAAKAKDACIDATCFIGPVVLDQQLDSAPIEWPGAYFPIRDADRPRVVRA